MRRILEYSLVILAMSFSMVAYGQDDKTKKDAQAAAAEAAQAGTAASVSKGAASRVESIDPRELLRNRTR